LLSASVNEGGEFDLPVQIRSATWSDAPLKAIGMRIRYNKSWMRYADTTALGLGLAEKGWTVSTSPEVMSGDDVLLSMELKGGTAVLEDYIVAKPRFRVLLSSEPSFKPRIDSVWFFTQDRCLYPAMFDAVVLPLGCVREIRQVELRSDVFALHTVVPNPLYSLDAEITYSLGFEAPLRIDLVDSYGTVYNLVQSEKHAGGHFTVRCSTRDLPSGSYRCVYSSAGVYNSIPVFIIR
jgi:hypothetical protein